MVRTEHRDQLLRVVANPHRAMRGSKETSAEPGGHAPGLNCSAVMSVRTTSLGAKVCVRCRRVPRSTTTFTATSFARKSSLGVGRNGS